MNVKRLILVLGLAGFIVMADNWVVSRAAAGAHPPTATEEA